jgi:hypothetical protein
LRHYQNSQSIPAMIEMPAQQKPLAHFLQVLLVFSGEMHG